MPPADAVPAVDEGWQRVHPLTPLIKSWQIVVVILIFVAQDFGRNAVQQQRSPWDEVGQLGKLSGRFIAGGGALLVAALGLIVLGMFLSWRMTKYRISADALELHHGILTRHQRRARLDRLQAVDVSQPLLARITGLARLTLEVAGSGDSRVELAYLTEREALSLRAHLLARAAGLKYDTAEAPLAPESPVVEVPLGRLIGSLVLSGAMAALLVIFLGLSAGAFVLGAFAPVAALLTVLIGSVGALWRRFSNGFGFTLAASPDGLRVRRGLLEHRAQTVPPGRVQAIRVEQPLLWRGTGWWRVKVNVAGYRGREDRGVGSEDVLLPVGTRAEAVRVLALLVPDLGDLDGDDAHAVVDAAMTGSGPGLGFVTAPPAARWLDPIGWWRIGYRVTGGVLLIRQGVLQRACEIVPHARTQSLGVKQGPLQRALRLASFAVHSTPGPVSPVVPHLGSVVAARLLDEQAARARQARAVAGPERWMEELAGQPGVQPGVEPGVQSGVQDGAGSTALPDQGRR